LAYLVVGLDVELDFLAGESADSVGSISLDAFLMLCGPGPTYLICILSAVLFARVWCGGVAAVWVLAREFERGAKSR
jgi:hypothetical protein